MQKISCLALFCLLFVAKTTLFAQHDSLRQQLHAVEISAEKKNDVVTSTTPLQLLDNQQLTALPTLQLADALKFLSGLVVKDYGGIGGIKTVAMRGFGAQHTAISYDGIVVNDCQTGQIDLGKFSLKNVESVALNSGSSDDIFLPARLTAAATSVQIATTKPDFKDNKKLHVAAHLTGGSFGLVNPSLLVENLLLKRKSDQKPLLTSSVYVNYLQADGKYPFTLRYGGFSDSTSREKRSNSDVRSLSAEANLFADFSERSRLQFKVFYYHSERGLPGATILYNQNSKQRLWDDQLFGQIQYKNHFNAKLAYQVNGKFSYAYQRYLDPHYLNIAGFLDNRYRQSEGYLSNSLLYKPHKIISLSISNDLIYNDLRTNIANFAKPQRISVLTVLAANMHTKFVTATANLLHTFVQNRVVRGETARNVNRFSPFVSLSLRPFPRIDFSIRAFYKNIFRLPSFNDMYYREVGNVHLKPENTHQLDFGLLYRGSYNYQKISVLLSVDGYFNSVTDKIVAIPNKNLFVWSMLNFGKVSVTGIDCNFSFSYRIVEPLTIELSGNYTFQQAVDVTNKQSKTFLQQIPYTPLHSGTGFVALRSRWVDLIYTVQIVGKRYALQQNIPANELAPYSDHAIAIAKDFHIKQFVLGVKGEVLNLADEQYEIIRNYPMQGRSFRISLKFEY